MSVAELFRVKGGEADCARGCAVGGLVRARGVAAVVRAVAELGLVQTHSVGAEEVVGAAHAVGGVGAVAHLDPVLAERGELVGHVGAVDDAVADLLGIETVAEGAAHGFAVVGDVRERVGVAHGSPDEGYDAFAGGGADESLENGRIFLVTELAVGSLGVIHSDSVESASIIGTNESAGPILQAVVCGFILFGAE